MNHLERVPPNGESDDQPSAYAWLARENDVDLPIKRTPETSHFFVDNDNCDLELVYHGSGLIVSLLEMHQTIESQPPEPGEAARARRSLAFFDKHGNFYGPVLLQGLVRNAGTNGTSNLKHTALFEPAAAPEEAFTIPIDDIYCLSLAKPADG